MIDYETYYKIKDCHERQKLTIAQTARAWACMRTRWPSG